MCVCVCVRVRVRVRGWVDVGVGVGVGVFLCALHKCVCARAFFFPRRCLGESVVKYDVKKEWYLPPDRRGGGDIYVCLYV